MQARKRTSTVNEKLSNAFRKRQRAGKWLAFFFLEHSDSQEQNQQQIPRRRQKRSDSLGVTTLGGGGSGGFKEGFWAGELALVQVSVKTRLID